MGLTLLQMQKIGSVPEQVYLTLLGPMEYYIKFDTVILGWSIVYLKGYNFQKIFYFFI